VTCDELQTLLPAYADGELDLVRHLEVEQHLQGCDRCARDREKLELLQATLRDPSFRFEPPPGLRGRVEASLRDQDQATRRRRRWLRLAVAASAAAAAVLAWGLFGPWSSRARDDRFAQEVVASHVRSLMVNHITDVTSSDRHEVKPWFREKAKLDFSLPVCDLRDHGFPLKGGRVDYFANRRVAALVYERRKHFINLLVWPDAAATEGEPEPLTRQGYQLFHWSQGGLTFWAVSDLNSAELRTFVELIRQQDAH
jgi:anti-sigma factor RsiW